jgi:hypothetical protein
MAGEGLRVPPEVDRFLVGHYVRAGAIGAGIGSSVGSGGAGSANGARGGARGAGFVARLMRTSVQDRDVPGSMTSDRLLAQLADVFPRAHRLASGPGVLRMAVPIGRTGLQQVVVDITGDPAPPGTDPYYVVPHGALHLRAYCKQGLGHPRLTARTIDRVVRALSA